MIYLINLFNLKISLRMYLNFVCLFVFSFQTESPLLIKPYIKYLTSSEIHAVMCCGFATVSGIKIQIKFKNLIFYDLIF